MNKIEYNIKLSRFRLVTVKLFFSLISFVLCIQYTRLFDDDLESGTKPSVEIIFLFQYIECIRVSDSKSSRLFTPCHAFRLRDISLFFFRFYCLLNTQNSDEMFPSLHNAYI